MAAQFLDQTVCVCVFLRSWFNVVLILSQIWRMEHSRPVAGGGGPGLPFFFIKFDSTLFSKMV